MDANTLSQALKSAVDQNIWNSDDFNNPDLLITPAKDVAIQWTDTGYYQIESDKVMFTDCTEGHVYTYRKTTPENIDSTKAPISHGSRKEWKMFQDLFVEASTSGLFRIDAPISREEIEVGEEIWEYTRVSHPGAGVGEIIDQHWSKPNSIEPFLNNIIDIYYYVIQAAIKVARNNSEIDSPILIPYIAIAHIIEDRQGYYFAKNFDFWNQSPDKVIRQNIQVAQFFIQEIAKSQVSDDFLNQWTTRAFNKWMSLL
jgi:hypothetical protein